MLVNTQTCLTQFAKEGNKLIGNAAVKSKVKYHRVRHEIKAVIPSLQGDASSQLPPDLPSYIFKERIVYLVSMNPNTSYLEPSFLLLRA